MKKIINNPADFVPEMLDGLLKAHPDQLAYAEDIHSIVRADAPVVVPSVVPRPEVVVDGDLSRCRGAQKTREEQGADEPRRTDVQHVPTLL